MATYHPVNRMTDYAHESKELLEQHPFSSVVVAFGLGVATGLACVALLSESTESSRHYSSAHRLGQQLLDAMSNVLPEAVSRSFRG
jgi:hypothetical protein